MPSPIHQSNSELYTVQDLNEYHPPRITHVISDGILDIGSKMMIHGDKSTWKSTLCLHAAYCLAKGTKWLGFRTTPSNVLFIQGEGTLYSFKKRACKYCEGTKRIWLAKPDPLAGTSEQQEEMANRFAYPDSVIMRKISHLHFDSDKGIAELKKNLTDVIIHLPERPLVLMADPVFKLFRHNMLDPNDVRYFTGYMDELLSDPDLLKYIPGMSLILVHHNRKPGVDKDGNIVSSGSFDMFGPAVFDWWTDSELRCDLNPEDKTRQSVHISIEKHREAEQLPPTDIYLRWDRDTLHPYNIKRIRPDTPDDITDIRSDLDLSSME